MEDDPPATIPTVAMDGEQATAELAIDSLIVTPELVLPGREAVVEAEVTNVGEADGTTMTTLTVNGVETDMCPLTLAPGDSDTISFTVTRDLAGYYDLSIGDMNATLTVPAVEEYHNETYNYTLSYPAGWTVSDSEAELVRIMKTSIGTITVATEQVPVDMTKQEYFLQSIETMEDSLIDFELTSQSELKDDGVVVGRELSYDFSEKGGGTTVVLC
ncbi:MAG: hypothetical protein HOC20_00975 [Chloroflexi bacterium]|nr:hypothetical protein [Chloroflexota bacterium]